MDRCHGVVATLLLIVAICLGMPGTARGGEAPQGEASSGQADGWGQEFRQGLRLRLAVLGFGSTQKPALSAVNPDNALGIPRHRVELDLRPDLGLTFRRIELSAKPRAEGFLQEWEEGLRAGERERDGELFVNEWLVRLRLANRFLVSYGRENLQWGPSALLSPSNPFNRDNGRDNPFVEVPGLDYGRAIWIPSASWTVSFIANTGEGRLERLRDFEPTYALKLDYTGTSSYFSVIPSVREGGEQRVGWFAGKTVSDGLLLYTEGEARISNETAAALLGGAYTFANRGTMTLEVYHQTDGCTSARVAECLRSGGGDKDLDDGLLRRTYVLGRYVETYIWRGLSVILRWTRSLDDGSSRAVAVVEYEIGDHFVPFLAGNVGLGDADDEFGSVLKHVVTVGLRCTF